MTTLLIVYVCIKMLFLRFFCKYLIYSLKPITSFYVLFIASHRLNGLCRVFVIKKNIYFNRLSSMEGIGRVELVWHVSNRLTVITKITDRNKKIYKITTTLIKPQDVLAIVRIIYSMHIYLLIKFPIDEIKSRLGLTRFFN